MKNAVLTKHAISRIKMRVGGKNSSCQKIANKALNEGISVENREFSGGLKVYVKLLYRNELKANNILVYGEFIYLFHNELLLTVLNVPNKFKKELKMYYN